MTSENKEKIKKRLDKNINEKSKKIRRNNLLIVVIVIITVISIYLI